MKSEEKSLEGSIGIFAYGSILSDFGVLETAVAKTIRIESPFPVEYAWLSQKRCGAPTLVKVDLPMGGHVKGGILYLLPTVDLEKAKSLQWQRETRSSELKPFVPKNTPASLQIGVLKRCYGLEHLLYTDFLPERKLSNPKPHQLAREAIQSAKKTKLGKDGITYLMENLRNGIVTPLSRSYEEEILMATKTRDLAAALEVARSKDFHLPPEEDDQNGQA